MSRGWSGGGWGRLSGSYSRAGARRVSVAAAVVALVLLAGSGSAGAAVLGADGGGGAASGSVLGPSTVPAAPIMASAQGEGFSVLASWLPNDSSDQVSSYELTATPDLSTATAACPSPSSVSVSVSGSDSSAYVEGLCVGIAYTVTATATNSVGTGPASNASQPAVPLGAQVPLAPMFTGALGRSGSAVVTWTVPSFDGGLTVTGYKVSATDPNGNVVQTVNASASDTSATVSGLVDGTQYTLKLVAVNAVGDSTVSTATATPSEVYAPSEPTGLTVEPDGTGNLDVAWAAPADDGGSSITGYTITYQQATEDSSGTWRVASGSQVHTIDVSGSTTSAVASSFEDSSAAYLFSVTARNSAGTSQADAAANGVSPTVGVKSTTVVLSESTVQAIAATSPTSITWDAPVPQQIQDLVTGNVLVAGVSSTLPDGSMQTVTAIDANGSGTTVTVQQASLGDVFTNMSMSTSVDPASSAVAGAGAQAMFVPSSSGVRSLGTRPSDIGVGVGASLESSFSLDQHRAARGRCRGQPERRGRGEHVREPEHRRDPDRCECYAKATAGVEVQGSFGFDGSRKFEIGQIDGAPIDIQIGPVPVVIVPEVPVDLTVEGKVAVNATASAQVGGELTWSSNDPGHLGTKNLSHPFQLDGGIVPGVSVTGTGTVGVGRAPWPPSTGLVALTSNSTRSSPRRSTSPRIRANRS